MVDTPSQLFAADALLPTGWARDVLLTWNAGGQLATVTPNSIPPAGVATACGPVIPGLPNLHSHAFQRAFAGLTEYRGPNPDGVQDSFWSWRTLMYRFAATLSPEQVEAIATWLYIEMLEAGYTSVCEFHYVHHAPDGRPYADDAPCHWPCCARPTRWALASRCCPCCTKPAALAAPRPRRGSAALFAAPTPC